MPVLTPGTEAYRDYYNAIQPVNGWVLRARGRSLAWLLLYPVAGMGIVPITIALLSRPGQPK